MNLKESNDLQLTITQALQEMEAEAGDSFEVEKINLAELERRTGISRAKLRKLKENGFIVKPHGLSGRKKEVTVLSGYTGAVNHLLQNGVVNSSVILDRIQELGYVGGKSQLKQYIHDHKDLVPAKRQIVAPQGNRGRRYTTGPGESYQMDWGFVNVVRDDGTSYQAACFAMICHHCGECYVEFFPNARQENLFIGMIHAFQALGIPQYVLTDNMKSVVDHRDAEGHPVWNADYERFMKAFGFSTKLCKPRHPFTKGKVERLVRFVKNNFMAGRIFGNITDLNFEARKWCERQNSRYHKGVDCVPHKKHREECLKVAEELILTDDLKLYLWPARAISFDGFVNYEGRRFGVPYWYTHRVCRVHREDFYVYIYSKDLTRLLAKHNVTWSHKDSFCEDQYVFEQPVEYPSAPVTTRMTQNDPPAYKDAFERFNFDKEVEW